MFLENESYTIHVIILVIQVIGKKKNNFPKLTLEDKMFLKALISNLQKSK